MNLFFSDTLRKLRNEKGLSQTELAERVYVTRSTVVRWETGSHDDLQYNRIVQHAQNR